jgi:hypothetical protein
LPAFTYGLDVTDKTERIYRFHKGTIHGALELLGAMGLDSVDELEPHLIFRRVDDLRVRNLAELYDYLEPGQLLEQKNLPAGMAKEWQSSRADRWTLHPETGQNTEI